MKFCTYYFAFWGKVRSVRIPVFMKKLMMFVTLLMSGALLMSSHAVAQSCVSAPTPLSVHTYGTTASITIPNGPANCVNFVVTSFSAQLYNSNAADWEVLEFLNGTCSGGSPVLYRPMYVPSAQSLQSTESIFSQATITTGGLGGGFTMGLGACIKFSGSTANTTEVINIQGFYE